MNLARLFAVIIVVTLAGGVFGAAVGALIGYAAPSSVQTGVGIEGDPDVANGATGTRGEGHVELDVQVDTTHDRRWIAPATALGAGFGLICGAVLGTCLAGLDQILLLTREAARRARRPTMED